MKYADADPDITLDYECMYSITGVFPYTDHLSYFINGALLIHRTFNTIVTYLYIAVDIRIINLRVIQKGTNTEI